jgi:hypothetical protein
MNKIHTEETKRKISLTLKGQKAWNKGTKASKKSKERMSKSRKLLWQNPEYRRRMINAKKGCIPWNKGKKGIYKHSEETKKKIGNAHKGMKRSEQTRRKMSIAAKGRKRGPLSIEHKKQISKRMKGKKGPQSIGWKNGRYMEKGYVRIYGPSHPFCNNKGYILEHRLVIERQINRFLKPGEEGHHNNQVRNDNRAENLMAFRSKAAHVSFENGNPINPSDIIFDGRKL